MGFDENETDDLGQIASLRREELFQNLPIACLGCDVNGTIMEWNRACEKLFHLGKSRLSHSSIYSLFCSEDQETLFQEITAEVFKDFTVDRFDWTMRDATGNTRYLVCSAFPLHNMNDEVVGAIFACLDVTAQVEYERQIEEQFLRLNDYNLEIEQSKWELEQANKRLASLAATDGLTGLQNHRAFQEAFSREVKRAEREMHDLSILLLDVDSFKLYNDSFGHPAGDDVLRKVSDILLRCSRGSDTVARYGGEEFVVILPNTDREGAEILAERMRKVIEMSYWEHRSITVSIGIATTNGVKSGPFSLIEMSDRALYRSKADGRNRTTHFDDLPTSSDRISA